MVWKSMKCFQNLTNFKYTCNNHIIFAIILIAIGGSLCFLGGVILLLVVSKQYFNDNQSEGLLLIAKAKGSIKEILLSKVTETLPSHGNKVTVVGIGPVGMACAFSILVQNIAEEVTLIDVNTDKLRGEMLDIQHGASLINNPKIQAGTDYALSANSTLCVVTAGFPQKKGESRLSLVQRNADILKDIIPQLIQHSPNAILLMVSNPVDIMTFIAWKISNLPINRVIGSGTTLDTARFRFLMSQKLQIAPSSCDGYIIGEHGDSSVPVWSSANIAGVRLRELNPTIGTKEDPENWHELHKCVVNSAYEIIKLKGYTNWGIGLSVGTLVSAILHNRNSIFPVSTMLNGHHGIDKDVFLSLPCVLNSNGVAEIVKLILSTEETEQMNKSANLIHKVQNSIKL